MRKNDSAQPTTSGRRESTWQTMRRISADSARLPQGGPQGRKKSLAPVYAGDLYTNRTNQAESTDSLAFENINRMFYGDMNVNEYGSASCPFCSCLNCMCRPFRKVSVYQKICGVKWCMPYSQIFWITTVVFLLLVIWAVLYAAFGERALYVGTQGRVVNNTTIHGDVFGFYMLCVSTYAFGWFCAYTHLPLVTGMFLTGLTLRNAGLFDPEWNHGLCGCFRAMALGFILMKVGLTIDPLIFKQRRALIARIAIVSALCEMSTAATLGWLVFDFPNEWAVLLGTTLSPVSPISTLVALVTLTEEGYCSTDVASVLLSVDAMDNIVLVTIYGLAVTRVLESHHTVTVDLTDIMWTMVVPVVFAVVAGLALGLFVTYFPHKDDTYCGVWRTVILGVSCMGAVIVGYSKGYDGAGYMCATIAAATASVGWRNIGTSAFQNHPINWSFRMGWHIIIPIIIGMYGAEVFFKELDIWNMLKCAGIVSCCLTVRFSAVFLLCIRSSLNFKERFFISMMCTPKGTMQAGLGPNLLRIARSNEKQYAKLIILMCIISLCLTLPFGSMLTLFLGHRLLKQSSPSHSDLTQWVKSQRNTSVVYRMTENDVFHTLKIHSTVIYPPNPT